MVLYALGGITHWHISSLVVNEIYHWLALFSYALLASLLSTLRPKWLTEIPSFLLFCLAPLAWLFLVMGIFFVNDLGEKQSIGDNFYVFKTRWDAGAMGSSGTNLFITYRPRYLPFLERSVNSVRFDDADCDSREAFLVIQPDKAHVLARCPWPEYEHKSGYHDFLVPLY